jgi:hypothetical protein
MSPEIEDIAAMRADGDLLDFIRSLTGQPPKQRTAPEPEPAPVIPRSRPGAWPDGTSPPGPLKPQPPGAWELALDRYRTGADHNDPPCECGCRNGGPP